MKLLIKVFINDEVIKGSIEVILTWKNISLLVLTKN